MSCYRKKHDNNNKTLEPTKDLKDLNELVQIQDRIIAELEMSEESAQQYALEAKNDLIKAIKYLTDRANTQFPESPSERLIWITKMASKLNIKEKK